MSSIVQYQVHSLNPAEPSRHPNTAAHLAAQPESSLSITAIDPSLWASFLMVLSSLAAKKPKSWFGTVLMVAFLPRLQCADTMGASQSMFHEESINSEHAAIKMPTFEDMEHMLHEASSAVRRYVQQLQAQLGASNKARQLLARDNRLLAAKLQECHLTRQAAPSASASTTGATTSTKAAMATPVTTHDQAGAFSVAPQNTESCLAGFVPIDSAAECKAAAVAHGWPYAGVANENEFPKGCSHSEATGDVIFNTDAFGAAEASSSPLCKSGENNSQTLHSQIRPTKAL